MILLWKTDLILINRCAMKSGQGSYFYTLRKFVLTCHFSRMQMIRVNKFANVKNKSDLQAVVQHNGGGTVIINSFYG